MPNFDLFDKEGGTNELFRPKAFRYENRVLRHRDPVLALRSMRALKIELRGLAPEKPPKQLNTLANRPHRNLRY
jgi:hypothetical protein